MTADRWKVALEAAKKQLELSAILPEQRELPVSKNL